MNSDIPWSLMYFSLNLQRWVSNLTDADSLSKRSYFKIVTGRRDCVWNCFEENLKGGADESLGHGSSYLSIRACRSQPLLESVASTTNVARL